MFSNFWGDGKGRQSIISTGRVFKHGRLEAPGVLAPRESLGHLKASLVSPERNLGVGAGVEKLSPSPHIQGETDTLWRAGASWRGRVGPTCPRHSNPWPAPGRRRVLQRLRVPLPAMAHYTRPPTRCLDEANREHQVRTQNYTELLFSLNLRQVEKLIINMINIIKYIMVLFVISLSFPF